MKHLQCGNNGMILGWHGVKLLTSRVPQRGRGLILLKLLREIMAAAVYSLTSLNQGDTMIFRLASALLLIFLISSHLSASGQQAKRFDPKDYPAGTFQVSRHDYPIGNYTIRIIQVRKVDDRNDSPPSLCRAWVEVRSGDRILRQIYYDDIDAVGGDYGIFVPEHQPLKDYFISLKTGDYDGRLLLIGRDGSLTNLPGGGYFLTPDKRYLISSHASDYESLVVVDVARRQIVIDGEKEELPNVGDWYLDNDGYFFTEYNYTGQLRKPHQTTVAITRLDLKHLKVKREEIGAELLKSLRKIKYDPWQNSSDCTSAP
jgi:hypothetical protein